MKPKQLAIWGVIFLAILVLTQLTLNLKLGNSSSFLGLPQWLWYSVLIHAIYIFFLFLFSKQSNKVK